MLPEVPVEFLTCWVPPRKRGSFLGCNPQWTKENLRVNHELMSTFSTNSPTNLDHITLEFSSNDVTALLTFSSCDCVHYVPHEEGCLCVNYYIVDIKNLFLIFVR